MRLVHGRVTLELERIKPGKGTPLLLLHALRGSGADWTAGPLPWLGAVYALDFCGHGRSDWLLGGAYQPELLVGDADAALAHLGTAALAGSGLGAYVALLLAGARPQRVPAALLLPGEGLAGGGAVPHFDGLRPLPPARNGCDELVYALERDVRPVDYATAFARAARRLILAEDGGERPPWWIAAAAAPGAIRVSVTETELFARLASEVV